MDDAENRILRRKTTMTRTNARELAVRLCYALSFQDLDAEAFWHGT
jgi:transcription termination factor NusB